MSRNTPLGKGSRSRGHEIVLGVASVGDTDIRQMETLTPGPGRAKGKIKTFALAGLSEACCCPLEQNVSVRYELLLVLPVLRV